MAISLLWRGSKKNGKKVGVDSSYNDGGERGICEGEVLMEGGGAARRKKRRNKEELKKVSI